MVFQKLRSQMKGVLIVVVAAFALGLFFIGGPYLGGGKRSAVNVAKVNGQVISTKELDEAYYSNVNFYQQYQGGQLSRMDADQVRFETLQQLINQKLLLQQARKNHIKVANKDIDAEIKKIKEGFPSDAEYRARLKESNITEAKLRELFREKLSIEALQKAKSTVKITDEDVKKGYEQVQVSHILIEPVGKDKSFDLAKTQAEKVLAEIKSGKTSFANAAKKYSADPGSKAKGGDIGYVGRDSGLVKEFLDAAFALKVGEISQPVKTEFGYHLIKVTGRKEAAGPEFEKAKADLKKRLEEEGGNNALQTWFNDVRAKARIEVLDPALRAMQFVASGQLPQAVAQYEEAIKDSPGDPYLHLALGSVKQQLNDPDAALAEFKQAASMNTNDPDIFVMLGLAYKNKNMNKEAAEQFRKASALDNSNFQLHLSLLQLFTSMKLDKDAKIEEAKLNTIQKQYEAQQKAAEEQAKAQAELQKKLDEQNKANTSSTAKGK